MVLQGVMTWYGWMIDGPQQGNFFSLGRLFDLGFYVLDDDI